MADQKISQLSSGAPAQAGDEYVVARSGANYKLTGTNVAALVAGTANTFSATQSFSVPAEFADGTAAAPTVTNTGDTDTGVYFPAANEVAVSTGGTVAAAFNSNGLFFRNRIINGDMRIDQRNAGAAVTTNGSFPVDRFLVSNTTDGAFSAQQDSSAPTGFVNSLKYTTTTADGTLTTTQQTSCQQRIEGTNLVDLAWGTADARAVTLSFWVRSSLTGTFGGSVTNSAINRAYPYTYTISAADTWEYKTITIPGDTTGTWLTTTGIGMRVYFGLGVGPDLSGTAGAWAATNSVSATGAVSVIGTLNATWYVTGVQLETGSVATPFERRPYGTELMLCQRYYYRLFPNAGQKLLSTGGMCFSTTLAGTYRSFPVPMRVAPSALEQSGTAAHYAVWDAAGNQIFGSSVPVFGSATTDIMAAVNLSVASGLVAGSSTVMTSGNSAAYLGWSAEL